MRIFSVRARTRWLVPALAAATLSVACSDDEGANDGSPADAGGNPSEDAAPPTPLLAEYELSSEDSVPEGVTFDPVERAFYVGSLRGGSVTKISADGTEEVLAEADGSSIAGVKVDAENRRLWACAGSELRVFDLTDGTQTHTFPLSVPSPGGGCNDVTVDADGRAYATDMNQPNIYTAHVDEADATMFATSPLFDAPSFGLNGLEVSDDGSTLYAAMLSTGKLLRVSLDSPDDVSEVTLSGATFSAPDGLVVLDGAVYAVSTADVKKVALADGDTSGVVTLSAFPDGGLSTGTAAEGQLYVVKSNTLQFILGQPLDLPFRIVRIELDSFQ